MCYDDACGLGAVIVRSKNDNRPSSTCHDTRVASPRHVQNHDELDLTETGSRPAPDFIPPGHGMVLQRLPADPAETMTSLLFRRTPLCVFMFRNPLENWAFPWPRPSESRMNGSLATAGVEHTVIQILQIIRPSNRS
jgi:hypothetical protein